ncbi:MAG: DEAD/DEAH box helicase family protein [Candidatus Contendobacter sp.]
MSLSEADTRAKLIDPALYRRGWTEDLIRREESAGAIHLVGDQPRRMSGRADYTLRIRQRAEEQPLAVALIEAKREGLPPTHGLEQVKWYADSQRLNVHFVFASNGHQFVEFDRFTGQTRGPLPMAEFPSPLELQDRYEAGIGFTLDAPEARPLLTPYPGGEFRRRYFQDAAIRAVLERIAQCRQRHEPTRALLALATGSGKTFIAVNLLKRLADAGQMTRALFICDRDELRTQALGALYAVFGSDAAQATTTNPEKNARVVVATYQTLGVERDGDDASYLVRHYPENYFSHLIIDECHRSAWGQWSQVLTRNAAAVQVGLTATPRQLPEDAQPSPEAENDAHITADNLRYFGEPVYEYTMAQAMADGYLAACEIRTRKASVDETGLTLEQILALQPRDFRTGRAVTVEELRTHYAKTQFEDRIMLPDRVWAMCGDLLAQLIETGGPEQKTIIFCASDAHADAVAAQLNNLYAQWCQAQGRTPVEHFAFKCTAESQGGQFLPEFRGSRRRYFIATTVDLLSTGVDVPCVRNVVFFRYLKSPIVFYQMVGRGTRLDENTGKLMFYLYDYTNVTALFGRSFITPPRPERPGGSDPPPPPPPPPLIVTVAGIAVQVSAVERSVLVDGEPVPLVEYKARMAARLREKAATLEQFRQIWITPPQRQPLMQELVNAGYPPTVVQMLEQWDACDLFDVLAALGYDYAPRTRAERVAAFLEGETAWLAGLPEPTAATVRALAGQFGPGGTEGLENKRLLDTPAVKLAGGVNALRMAGKPAAVMQETKRRLFGV